jgi:hypothetical protein
MDGCGSRRRNYLNWEIVNVGLLAGGIGEEIRHCWGHALAARESEFNFPEDPER